MPTFGFSAFLKLISLNSRPQLTELRKRTAPSRGQGYDFHRSLRRLSRRYVVDGDSLAELLREVGRIGREPERRSAKAGIERLSAWREINPGRILHFDPVLYESPAKNFKVQYLPDFGVEMDGQKVAIHIWNTGKPDLDTRMAYAALSLFPGLYAAIDDRPDDLAVLSLPESRLYRLSEAEDHTEMAIRLVNRIDDLFERLRSESKRPATPPRGRPAPPPTPK